MPIMPIMVQLEDSKTQVQEMRDFIYHYENNYRERIRPPLCIVQTFHSYYPRRLLVVKAKAPNEFSVRLFRFRHDLEEVEAEMATFYEDLERRLPSSYIRKKIKIGDFYAVYSYSKRRWVRCLSLENVSNVPRTGGQLVQLVDYAEKEYVDSMRIRELPSRFCQLSAQGYKASLLLSSGDRQKIWSAAECSRFRENVLMKVFRCRIVHYDPNYRNPYCPRIVCVLEELDKDAIGRSRRIFGHPHNNGTAAVEQRQ